MVRRSRPAGRLESHSSFKNDERLQRLLMRIDQLGMDSSNSMHISSIKSYFYAIEQLYFNVATILPAQSFKEVEEIRERYYKLLDRQEIDPRFRTIPILRTMLRICKTFNFHLIHGLQKNLQYFFRKERGDVKGIKNIKFFLDESIFATGKKNGKDKK